MSWRIGILLAFIIAAAVMAYQIGSRLSDQAIMMIVGVSCGIIASIPVSLGLLIALTRDRTANAAEEVGEPEPEPASAFYSVYRPPVAPQAQIQPAPQMPQIIVLAPPGQPLQNNSPYGNYLLPSEANILPAPMQERNFKIIGDQDDE